MTNRTEQPSRGTAQRVMAFAVFALLSLSLPGAASAQWTSPDAQGNISNTNTGGVGVGNSSPYPGFKLTVGNSTQKDGSIVIEGQDTGPHILFNTGGINRGRITTLLNGLHLQAYSGSFQRNDIFIRDDGNVGVGTAAPTSRLEVRGATSDANSSAFGVTNSSGQRLFAVRNDGYASVTIPAGTRGGLSISGDGNQAVYSDFIMRPETSTGIATGKPLRFGFSLMKNASYGGDSSGPSFVLSGTIQGGGIYVPLIVNPNGNLILAGSLNATNGNVGIGTTAPSSKLHVAGDITVDGNINAKYQDVAEWVPSTQKLSPGMVVILDPKRPNHVLASSASYDTAVAGVVSARPGLTLGEPGDNKALVATTGRVKVRVDATRAPIRIGDLLVTSDVAGVAMKSEPVPLGGRKIHAPGTIIGKALEPLAGGAGEILVLLSLQ